MNKKLRHQISIIFNRRKDKEDIIDDITYEILYEKSNSFFFGAIMATIFCVLLNALIIWRMV